MSNTFRIWPIFCFFSNQMMTGSDMKCSCMSFESHQVGRLHFSLSTIKWKKGMIIIFSDRKARQNSMCLRCAPGQSGFADTLNWRTSYDDSLARSVRRCPGTTVPTQAEAIEKRRKSKQRVREWDGSSGWIRRRLCENDQSDEQSLCSSRTKWAVHFPIKLINLNWSDLRTKTRLW